MVSQGAPSRSSVAIAEPSSVAKALPTPCRRKDQAAMSVALVPLRVVGIAQAHVFGVHLVHAALAAQLQQGSLEPGEVALAPGRRGNTHDAAVQVDHPAVAR